MPRLTSGWPSGARTSCRLTTRGVPFPSGAVFHRGPPVRSQRIVVEDRTVPRGTVVERMRQRGTVVDADGAPLAGVWVALPDLAQVAESDERADSSSTECLRDPLGNGPRADGRQVTAAAAGPRWATADQRPGGQRAFSPPQTAHSTLAHTGHGVHLAQGDDGEPNGPTAPRAHPACCSRGSVRWLPSGCAAC